MKLIQVKEELLNWGRFWVLKETGAGFASVSITHQCCEIMRTQVQSSGTSHQVAHLADSIHVPDAVQAIDSTSIELSDAQRKWIRTKYIKSYHPDYSIHKRNVGTIDNLYTHSAELKLSGLL